MSKALPKISEIIAALGGSIKLSQRLGCTASAVRMWKQKQRIPAKFHWSIYTMSAFTEIVGRYDLRMTEMPKIREDYD